MILSTIRHYLEIHHVATLNDLAIHSDSAPEVVRDMLQLWVRKGKIRRIQTRSGCDKGCGSCTCAAVEAYQWVRGAADPSSGRNEL